MAAAQKRAVPGSQAQVQLSFAPVVKEAAPAVVSVTTRKEVEVTRDPFGSDPFFQYFFRDFGVPFKQEKHEQNSLGSGVIVRDDGLIVTNNHVIEGADEITVILADRRELAASVVAADERADLAFLKLAEPPALLPIMHLGDSDRIEVGDIVLAIGNPFGIGQTVTSGIVSAKSRTTPGGRSEVSFIQTDAAINPGNSGGALVSLGGELVGVNTAIFTRGGGSIGIGFAIPANLVRAQMASIDSSGHVQRPWLGASVQAVDTSMAQALGLPRPTGVLINNVYPGSAAAVAGLAKRDVILEADGVEISDEPGLNLRLALAPGGGAIKVKRWRDGRIGEVAVKSMPAPRLPEPDLSKLAGKNPLSGLEVANMSPAYNEELGLDMFAKGVVVVGVPRSGFVTKLRLRVGDIIVAINDAPVDTVGELEGLLEKRPKSWEITVRRGGQSFKLTVS